MKKLLIKSDAQYRVWLKQMEDLARENHEEGTLEDIQLRIVRNAVRDYEAVNENELSHAQR